MLVKGKSMCVFVFYDIDYTNRIQVMSFAEAKQLTTLGLGYVAVS